MPFYDLIAIAFAGLLAGAVNAIAGAGSLLTYPVLVAFGIPPVAANVTNDIGVVPGNISGTLAMRERLHTQDELSRRLVPRAVIGAVIGAVLLLALPGTAFGWVAPPLVFVASVLTLAQPSLIQWSQRVKGGRRLFHATINVVAIYGGYFGTGIGLLFMATLGIFVDGDAQDLNAVKTLLQAISNGVAGVIFAFAAHVHWPAAAAMAIGSLGGGKAGALIADRISANALRNVVAAIGLAAAVWLFIRQLS